MESVWQLNLPLIQALQSAHWLAGPMQMVTWLGSEPFFLLFVALLYWCLDRRLGGRVVLILLLSTSLSSALKLGFAHPRPSWLSPAVMAVGMESTFGFPSAHAQNAVAVWGELAKHIKGRWINLFAIAAILLVGFSRLYLGVHFVTDVLAGWAIGLIILWLFERLADRVLQRVRQFGLGGQGAIALLTSLLLLLPSVLLAWGQSPWAAPATWPGAPDATVVPLNPLSLETPVAAAGTWLGFVAGSLWRDRRSPFSPQGNLQRRAIQYGIGMAGAIALWAGLDQLFPEGQTALAYCGRYLRYALLGGWIAAGAPIVFQWLGRSRRA